MKPIDANALMDARDKAIRVYENANVLNAGAIREGLKPLLDLIVDTRMIEWYYKETCPFCGQTHFQRIRINIICPCGAKYYFHKREWLNRERRADNAD